MDRRFFISSVGAYALLKILSTQAATVPANGHKMPVTTPATSLDDFLKKGGHVLGYGKLPDDPAAQKNFDEQSTALVTSGTNKTSPIPDSKATSLFGAFEVAARVEPGEPFLAHIDVAHETISHPKLRDAAGIRRRLAAWSQSGIMVHENGTFYSSAIIGDVLAGPQSGLRYKLGDLQTPLDAAQSGAGDCKTSAMERYALLQELAAHHKINAGIDDVFMLEVISKDPNENIGHTVAGYFDHGRQALLIFDGTGYDRPPRGQKPEINSAFLYEDTQKGRAALSESVQDILSLRPDFIPAEMQTRTKAYSFDLFNPRPGRDGNPQIKTPVIDPGKPDPVVQIIPDGPLDVAPEYKNIIGTARPKTHHAHHPPRASTP